jgi:hypothetical protein
MYITYISIAKFLMFIALAKSSSFKIWEFWQSTVTRRRHLRILVTHCYIVLWYSVSDNNMFMIYIIHLCDKVWQWLAAGRWFFPCTSVSSTNKTDSHDIAEILLKVSEWVSEWVSDYYLTPTKYLFSYIMARTSWLMVMMMSALHQTNTLSWNFIVPAHWNNGPRMK